MDRYQLAEVPENDGQRGVSDKDRADGVLPVSVDNQGQLADDVRGVQEAARRRNLSVNEVKPGEFYDGLSRE